MPLVKFQFFSIQPHSLLLTALTLILLGSSLSGEPASKPSIETLLRQSQEALLKSQPATKPKTQSETRKKDPHPASPDSSPVTEERTLPSSVPQAANVEPIDTTALQKVITVDLQASQWERKLIYPIAKISLSGGMQFLNPVYSLMKDDDHFSNTSGGRLAVFGLAINPTWRLRALDTKTLRTFVSATIQLGYGQGNVPMRRTGVHPSNSTYSVKMFPGEVGLQIEVEAWRKIGGFLGFGPALEVFHQDGVIGVNDTVTDIFYGDEIWVGLNASVADNIKLFLSYKYKGTRLLIRSSNFGGQVLAAGVTFDLFG